jgi:hypothetical protein
MAQSLSIVDLIAGYGRALKVDERAGLVPIER